MMFPKAFTSPPRAPGIAPSVTMANHVYIDGRAQRNLSFAPSAAQLSVFLPDATTLPAGDASFRISNTSTSGKSFAVRRLDGSLLQMVAPGGVIDVSCLDTTSTLGSWAFTGRGLCPVNVNYVGADANYGSAARHLSMSSGRMFVVPIGSSIVCIDRKTGKVSSFGFGLKVLGVYELTDATFVAMFTSTTAGAAIVYTVNPNGSVTAGSQANITYGTQLQSVQYTSMLCHSSTQLSVAGMGNNGAMVGAAASVSGTTVTWGSSQNNTSAVVRCGNASGYAYSATTGLICYENGANPHQQRVATFEANGTTFTWKNDYTLGTAASGGNDSGCIHGVVNGIIIIGYYDNGTASGKLVGATCSGFVLTFGAPVAAPALNAVYFAGNNYRAAQFDTGASTAIFYWQLQSFGLRHFGVTAASINITAGSLLQSSGTFSPCKNNRTNKLIGGSSGGTMYGQEAEISFTQYEIGYSSDVSTTIYHQNQLPIGASPFDYVGDTSGGRLFLNNNASHVGKFGIVVAPDGECNYFSLPNSIIASLCGANALASDRSRTVEDNFCIIGNTSGSYHFVVEMAI